MYSVHTEHKYKIYKKKSLIILLSCNWLSDLHVLLHGCIYEMLPSYVYYISHWVMLYISCLAILLHTWLFGNYKISQQWLCYILYTFSVALTAWYSFRESLVSWLRSTFFFRSSKRMKLKLASDCELTRFTSESSPLRRRFGSRG